MEVAVIGASPKAERYSNKAVRLLKECGYSVIPINPAYSEIEGLHVVPRIEDLTPGSVHTVTIYIGAEHSATLGFALVSLRPKRVIFNPGAENPELEDELTAAGIEVEEACTLVLLKTGQF